MPDHVALSKACGGDFELCNFHRTGVGDAYSSCHEASHALLEEIDGAAPPHAAGCDCPLCRRSGWGNGNGQSSGLRHDPRDWGRKFLGSTGGCIYVDLGHLEICLPEVLSARDHLASWHAHLRIARDAMLGANAKLPAERRIEVLVNNSDGLDHSWGGHLNFLVTRRCWKTLFQRKLQHLTWLASYQISSIVFAGQGKVGSENRQPATEYQLTQRGDFFETLIGEQTTYNRPVVNSRGEPLCGGYRFDDLGMSRLHVIFYDSNLCHVAHFLKIGVMQIVLAMLEQECIDTRLTLDDPLNALLRWGHDPTLHATAAIAGGKRVTATELQLLFLEQARQFVAAGRCDGLVPEAAAILELWEETLLKLAARDLPALVGRVDWVLKRTILERAMQQRPELTWESPQIKHLDHLYSSLDLADGLYWLFERDAVVERLIEEEQIERFRHEPPPDTRAWTRAMLLRHVGPHAVDGVDWDGVCVRVQRPGGVVYRRVELPSPLASTRAANERAFRGSTAIEEILDALGASETGGPLLLSQGRNPGYEPH